jgi:glycosyltransferase involved in cell wall biosynthesis
MRRPPSRVLYISFASPVPSKLGPARRNYQVIRQLSRFFDVSVLSPGTPDDAASFARELGERVRAFEFVPRTGGRARTILRRIWRTARGRCDFLAGLDPALRRRCAELLASGSFDAVFLASPLLRELPIPPGIPVVGDTHNVEFDVCRQMATTAAMVHRRLYARRQWVATREAERRAGLALDLLLATSEHDRAAFQRLGIDRIAVIPNGIDLEEFALSRRPSEPGMILLPGLMSYYPNQQAAAWFLDEIFPAILRSVPDACFVAAGAAPPGWLVRRRRHNVVVTGGVPDMRPYLERASVVVVPLRIGGGTRVKILEAQAAGRPVVSTTLGAEGLNLCHPDSILLADSADAFAAQVVHLLESPALRHAIAANARQHVVRQFDWNRIGERLGAVMLDRIGLVANQEPGTRTDERAW